METHNPQTLLALRALKRAARKARERARRNNLKIPVWIDGETHWIVPEPEEDGQEEFADRGTEGRQFIYDEKFD